MLSAVVFVIFLGLTVACLVAAVVAGHLGRRRYHLPLVVSTVALLGITIWRALVLGTAYDLESTGAIYPSHLLIARVTVLALIAPTVAGLMTVRNPERRQLHGRLAWIALALTVVTAGTGAALIFLAPPI